MENSVSDGQTGMGDHATEAFEYIRYHLKRCQLGEDDHKYGRGKKYQVRRPLLNITTVEMTADVPINICFHC